MLSALDRKLVRDLGRLWAQVLAVALVMGCGAMTLILALGTTRSLVDTRTAFYERYRFASVFADVTRAPLFLKDRIHAIDGVGTVEMRIVKGALLDIEGMREPGSAIAASIPDHRDAAVNRLYIRSGRLPEPNAINEVAIVERFADAHGFSLGDNFATIMNGQKRQLEITGIVLSPEYIYAIGPGDMVPDPRRFGIFFMSQKALSAVYDMEGAFNNVVVTSRKDADLDKISKRMDDILKPYGGTGAYTRNDHPSHAFLDAELEQLKAMASVMPPVFLFISAFLVNMILSRLVALEREQIGLLKAVGYSNVGVGWHYAKLVIAISFVGLFIGSIAGTWLGRGMTQLYGTFFSFPFLIFSQRADLYIIAGSVTASAALAGAANAIWSTVKLPPAVAMRPPAPTRYRSLTSNKTRSFQIFSQLTTMALRHIIRWPIRTGLTIFGTSLSVALLVTALFSFDSIDSMIDTIFFQTQRQDATLTFATAASPNAMATVRKMPGVLMAEEFRTTAVTLRNGHLSKSIQLLAEPKNAQLSRILDVEEKPVSPPSGGILMSERLAEQMDLRPGDLIELELLERDDQIVQIPLIGTISALVGLTAYIEQETLDRVLITGPRVSGARIRIDQSRISDVYSTIKKTPSIASIALLGISREQFRATIEENILISVTVYVTLAVIITFGVIYNSARIQLSERARELASLRVFGFTRAEVSSVLLVELAVIVIVAQPIGWLIGYGFAYLVSKGFESDLFRIPLIINVSTYATSSLVVVTAAIVSALIVRRRVDNLDLIRVLKTRE